VKKQGGQISANASTPDRQGQPHGLTEWTTGDRWKSASRPRVSNHSHPGTPWPTWVDQRAAGHQWFREDEAEQRAQTLFDLVISAPLL